MNYSMDQDFRFIFQLRNPLFQSVAKCHDLTSFLVNC